MKTTYIHLLPKLLQERLYIDLQRANPRACNDEINDNFQDALNSRLCDLEDAISISNYLTEFEFWKEIDREVGTFEGGDIVWDIDGNSYLIMSKTDLSKIPKTLCAKDARELYIEGNLQSMCVNDVILPFPDCILEVKDQSDY